MVVMGIKLEPAVDEELVAKHSFSDYQTAEIFQGFNNDEKQSNKRMQKRILPPIVRIEKTVAETIPHIEVDIIPTTKRISQKKQKDEAVLNKSDWVFSGFMHFCLVSVAFLSVSLFQTKLIDNFEAQPVELVFGLGDELRNTEKRVEPGPPVPEQEALKRPELLPQLPKQVVIKESEIVDPNAVPMPSDAKPMPTPIVQLTATPPPGAKVLTAAEVLKRMEKENRKVGEKTQEGVKDPKGKSVAKDLKFDVPPAPMTQSIPDAPPGLAGAGTLEGRVNATVKDAYTVAATNHLRRIWSLPESKNFDANLSALVVFEIDTFGRMIGNAQVAKSSGNNEFDNEALAAVQGGSPYPDLPQELAPRMRITVKLAPRDAKP